MRNVTHLFVHNTATARDTTSFLAINRGHKIRNWGTKSNPLYAKPSSLGFYIQYHHLILADGTDKRARTDEEIGWHAGSVKHPGDENANSIAICLTGNFDLEEPSQNQLDKLVFLLERYQKKYNIPSKNILFHRDVYKSKTCPGTWWTHEKLTNLLATRMGSHELKRDQENGKFYFSKRGTTYKQYIDPKDPETAISLLLTIISRSIGVDNMATNELGKLEDKNFV